MRPEKPITVSEFCKRHNVRPQMIHGWIRKNNMPHTSLNGKRAVYEGVALEWIEDWRGSSRKRRKVSERAPAKDDNWDLPPVGSWYMYVTKDSLGVYDAFARILEYGHAVEDREKEDSPVDVVVQRLHVGSFHTMTTTWFGEALRTGGIKMVARSEVVSRLRRDLARPAVFAVVDGLASEDVQEEVAQLCNRLCGLLQDAGDIRIGNTVYMGGTNEEEESV